MSRTFEVFTLFPQAVDAFVGAGLLGKAVEKGLVSVHCTNYRDFTSDRHRTVDDTPFGGGAGMVIKPEPVVAAMEHVAAERGPFHRVLLTPSAPRFDQRAAVRLAGKPRIGLLCGRYEGIDDRVREHFVDECFSIGDYVLGGGEVAALVVIEAVSRLAEGVLGNPESVQEESFSHGALGPMLEHPQYTRPPVFREHVVPGILLRGHHGEVEQWRLAKALERTHAVRADLRPAVRMPTTPVHLCIDPATIDDLSAFLGLASRHGVAAVHLLNAKPPVLESWKRIAPGSLEVHAFRSRRDLLRLLRRRSGGDPWWVDLQAASTAQPAAFGRGAALWDYFRLRAGADPAALVIAVHAPGGACELLQGGAHAVALIAPFPPSGDHAPNEKTGEEGLASPAVIADASRPPSRLCPWVDRALTELLT